MLNDAERARIAAELAAFLKAGGEIESLPHWVGDNDYRPSEGMKKARENGAKKGGRKPNSGNRRKYEDS